MTQKLLSPRAAMCLSLFSCLLIGFSSCKVDRINPTPATTNNVTLKASKVNYIWGELAINKKTESDAIAYNATTGKIDSVVTFDNNGLVLSIIDFTYSANKITLNTTYNDEYDLDNTGKVVYHSTQEVQQGHNIVEIQRFSYDANDYLSKVTMSLSYDGSASSMYSEIDYVVQNGNYTKYTLSNTDSGTVTRQYTFTYNTGKTVNSPCSFFAPIFAENTEANIDKYLNYGKSSVNLLSGVSYTILNLDKMVSTGSFNVVTQVNTDNYITSLSLSGSDVAGNPSDNVSPFPRSISFNLK